MYSPLIFRNINHSIQGRNYPHDSWVFMLVEVCQDWSIREDSTHPCERIVLAFLLIQNKGGLSWHT